MTVPVKVVIQIRRTGTNATTLRTALDNNRTALTNDCAAALLGLDPNASFTWSMRVNSRGNSVYHLYPKVEVDLPAASTYESLWPCLRAVRDAIVARIQAMASGANWTLQATYTKTYGGS